MTDERIDPEEWSAEELRDPRTGEYMSTAARYRSGPSARIVNRYEYDETQTLRCWECGWHGPACDASIEYHDELFDVSCANCDTMLLIVPYPTHEETKKAAAAGNETARQNLVEIEARERRWARAKQLQLKPDSDLPKLKGERLQFIWDIENPDHTERPDDDVWTVIKCGETTIWRELAFWEGSARFNEVKNILKARYGSQFARLVPTQASEGYLYGDAWGSAKLEYT